MRARYDVRGRNERMRAKGGLQYVASVCCDLVSQNSASPFLRPYIPVALSLLGIYHAGIDPGGDACRPARIWDPLCSVLISVSPAPNSLGPLHGTVLLTPPHGTYLE